MRSGLAAFADEQRWVLLMLGKMALGRNSFEWTARLVWMLGLALSNTGLSSWPNPSCSEPVCMTWVRHSRQIVKVVKECATAFFTLTCTFHSLVVFHHWKIGYAALLPDVLRDQACTRVMLSLSRPQVRGSPCSNAFVVCIAMMEVEYKGTKSWNDLWKVVLHPVPSACGKKKEVCPPWDISLPHPSLPPCLFCSTLSFLVLVTHQLLFFFFSLLFSVFDNLCKSQLMYSKVMIQQASHDV